MTGSDYKDSGHKWLRSIPKASQCVRGERWWEEGGEVGSWPSRQPPPSLGKGISKYLNKGQGVGRPSSNDGDTWPISRED